MPAFSFSPSVAAGRAGALEIATTTGGVSWSPLASGAARSLQPQRAVALRVAQGCAWVTLDDGPYGLGGESAGDVFLQPGQTLWVAAGQHAVLEAVGPVELRYGVLPLERGAARLRRWWQRAQMGPAEGAVSCA